MTAMTTRRSTFAVSATCHPPRGVLRLHRLGALVGVLGCAFTAPVFAQTHKVAAPEKVTRAVGVYEWTGDLAKPTAARLVPVSLFIESAFQDAGTFYSRPVPLALLNDNIYSLEKAGVPQGNVTLTFARHLQTATNTGSGDLADLGWFGYGSYSALPVPKKAAPLKASKTTSTIVGSRDSEDRPHFSNKSEKSSADTAAPSPRTSQPPRTATTPAPAPPADDDRPKFSKRPVADTPDTTSATPPKSDTTADTTKTSPSRSDTTRSDTDRSDSNRSDTDRNDPDRPTLRHRDPKQAEADRKARAQSGVSALPGTLNSDPDRPTMKRGAITGPDAAPTQLSGVPASLHQVVAVSDAVTRETHPFARDWATATERAEVLAKLQIVAQEQLASYAKRFGATAAPASPRSTDKPVSRSRRGPPAITPRPSVEALANEQLMSYTLSYGGLPTFVYTAIAPPPPAGGATAITPPERYVTVVTQLLPSGEMQLALASVTDAAHLDRTPWFRLIDVVDPDAGHRASILFELRGQTSRQFALYRILSAKADQVFVTSPNY